MKRLLKLDSIQFTDSNDNIYFINGNRVESFPLVGGEEANIITTQVWNQHGNTYINALMEAFDGELIFSLYTRNMRPAEIEAARRKLINICNPLNGTIRMTATLNNGSVYHRDISFTSAPFFPIGIDNRNYDWQKIQLMFTANNPFWYSETTIVESFQGSEPLFNFPFTMSTADPVIFGNIIPSNVAINSGQAEAPIIIEIKGACVESENHK